MQIVRFHLGYHKMELRTDTILKFACNKANRDSSSTVPIVPSVNQKLQWKSHPLNLNLKIIHTLQCLSMVDFAACHV